MRGRTRLHNDRLPGIVGEIVLTFGSLEHRIEFFINQMTIQRNLERGEREPTPTYSGVIRDRLKLLQTLISDLSDGDEDLLDAFRDIRLKIVAVSQIRGRIAHGRISREIDDDEVVAIQSLRDKQDLMDELADPSLTEGQRRSLMKIFNGTSYTFDRLIEISDEIWAVSGELADLLHPIIARPSS